MSAQNMGNKTAKKQALYITQQIFECCTDKNSKLKLWFFFIFDLIINQNVLRRPALHPKPTKQISLFWLTRVHPVSHFKHVEIKNNLKILWVVFVFHKKKRGKERETNGKTLCIFCSSCHASSPNAGSQWKQGCFVMSECVCVFFFFQPLC